MKQKGLTLIELLVVLILMTLILTICIPVYSSFKKNNQAEAEICSLVTAINFARQEAILKHVVITLCPSKNGKVCSDFWKDGWIVFVDNSEEGLVTKNDVILRVFPSVPMGSNLIFQASRSNNFLQMDSNGDTKGQTGTFYFYPDVKNELKSNKVIVSLSGRVRVE